MLMSKMNEREVLLEVKNLKQYFKINSNTVVKAIDDISFNIYKGETFGLVGESGSGKSTTGRSIIRLYQPTAGEVYFKGKNIATKLTKKEKAEVCQKIQMIFQDPMACLNPRMRVIDIIAEGIDVHKLAKNKQDREEKVYKILEAVGLSKDHAGRYPHEFSGGQRQRIGIARALITNPEFIIADEPISALDVSIQAQIINLLQELKEKQHLTYLFITHDLSVVKFISDRIGVMYLGNMVETADSEELFAHPLHPYTEALINAIPTTDPDASRQPEVLEGDIPSPVNPPKGCKFHTRCKYCTEICTKVTPEWEEVRPNHFVACHHILEQNNKEI